MRRPTLRGKEVTAPPKVQLQPGDEVTVYYDGFVLVVLRGVKIDEDLLGQAITQGLHGREHGEQAEATKETA